MTYEELEAMAGAISEFQRECIEHALWAVLCKGARHQQWKSWPERNDVRCRAVRWYLLESTLDHRLDDIEDDIVMAANYFIDGWDAALKAE